MVPVRGSIALARRAFPTRIRRIRWKKLHGGLCQRRLTGSVEESSIQSPSYAGQSAGLEAKNSLLSGPLSQQLNPSAGEQTRHCLATRSSERPTCILIHSPQVLQSPKRQLRVLIFISKFEFLLRRLKAAWNDLMLGITAQAPNYAQSAHAIPEPARSGDFETICQRNAAQTLQRVSTQ